MKSVRELFKVGKGPSSSHTIGPEKACKDFLKQYETADAFSVVLFGSLAKTGKGHGTDEVIKETLKNVEIVFDTTTEKAHPNCMELTAYKLGKEIGFERVFSVGGGAIYKEGKKDVETEVYQENSFDEVKAVCKKEGIRLSDYVFLREGEEIKDYLQFVWENMLESIESGLNATGELPGTLHVQRKAGTLFKTKTSQSSEERENRLVCAYAFAVSEQNASHGKIVTAPTCGSAGVLPSVLKYLVDKEGLGLSDVVRALAVAGLIGNLIKHNASISGAECGCQAEIGSACSMTAAAIGELHRRSIDEIEYAAEVAMEHHLGLTCDPIQGYVQIPCIERNAVAAMRAVNAERIAVFLAGTRKISFDLVVKTMYETGKDLSKNYRETSEGGLAKLYK